ncbi:hypothetical protein [Demequina sp.]|uniref:hypothetical protein n=1 Tax=Demequina sp. TaxID=2050685 RepID=UPI0025B8433D|nr:hypothetical protein [Demequina sp.]
MKNASGTVVWMLGALLVSILVGAGVYFLLISPELEKTSTATTELESAREFNDLLDTQILAAQSAEKNVDDWYAEIAAISLDLPPTPEQAALERLVNDSLRKQGLPTVTMTYGTPTDVVPPTSDVGVAVGADPADADTGVDATAEPSASAAPSADPVAPADTPAPVADSPQVTGLVQTPVTITTEGKPAPILRFLLDMQTQNSRFFTVTNFDISRSAGADAQAARPLLEEGDWVINITGLVFNLFDPELSLPIKEPATTPPFTGDITRNAFVPIPGTGNAGTP